MSIVTLSAFLDMRHPRSQASTRVPTLALNSDCSGGGQASRVARWAE